jgi:uncharacterized protein with PIN domain
VAGLLDLDASAIVKLVVTEAESEALRDALRGRPSRVSSALALVEVRLAAARRTPSPSTASVDAILAGLTSGSSWPPRRAVCVSSSCADARAGEPHRASRR